MADINEGSYEEAHSFIFMLCDSSLILNLSVIPLLLTVQSNEIDTISNVVIIDLQVWS